MAVVEAGAASAAAGTAVRPVGTGAGTTPVARQLGSANLTPALRHNLLRSLIRPEKPSRAATQYGPTDAETPK